MQSNEERVFKTAVSDVYPHYLAKVVKKGRSEDELIKVISWLTGFNKSELKKHLSSGTNFEDFFKQAKLNPGAEQITGAICGVKIQEIENPLMKKIRYLDKVVDELAKGRPLEKIKRSS